MQVAINNLGRIKTSPNVLSKSKNNPKNNPRIRLNNSGGEGASKLGGENFVISSGNSLNGNAKIPEKSFEKITNSYGGIGGVGISGIDGEGITAAKLATNDGTSPKSIPRAFRASTLGTTAAILGKSGNVKSIEMSGGKIQNNPILVVL